jgi:hypothetical protein
VDQFCTATQVPTPFPVREEAETPNNGVFEFQEPSKVTFDVSVASSSFSMRGLPMGVLSGSQIGVGGKDFAGPVKVVHECSLGLGEDYQGKLLLVGGTSMCTLYDLGRRAQNLTALGIVVAMDSGPDTLPTNRWLQKDAFLRVPLFTVTHATKDAILSLSSRFDLLEIPCKSPGCVNALITQYDVFHGAGNTFSNRLRTLCAPDHICSVQVQCWSTVSHLTTPMHTAAAMGMAPHAVWPPV